MPQWVQTTVSKQDLTSTAGAHNRTSKLSFDLHRYPTVQAMLPSPKLINVIQINTNKFKNLAAS